MNVVVVQFLNKRHSVYLDFEDGGVDYVTSSGDPYISFTVQGTLKESRNVDAISSMRNFTTTISFNECRLVFNDCEWSRIHYWQARGWFEMNGRCRVDRVKYHNPNPD